MLKFPYRRENLVLLEYNIGDADPDPRFSQPSVLFLTVSGGENLWKSLSKTGMCDTWCSPSLHVFELRVFMARCGPRAVAPWENMSSLPLKPQKLVSPAVPLVEELLLPLSLLSWLLQASTDGALLLVLLEKQTISLFADSFCTLRSHLFHRVMCPTSLLCSFYSKFLYLWSSLLPFSEHLPVLL